VTPLCDPCPILRHASTGLTAPGYNGVLTAPGYNGALPAPGYNGALTAPGYNGAPNDRFTEPGRW